MKTKRIFTMNSHFNIILSVIVVVFVVTISIGYSAFNTSLNITGVISKVRAQKDIRVTGLQYSGNAESGLSTYEEYNSQSLLMGVHLPNQDSTVTYKVTVTNLGNTEMGIFSIDNLPSNLNYTISDYNLKDKICDDSGQCSLGISKTFYITIGYKPNGYNATSKNHNIQLNVNFKEFCTVSYNGVGATVVPATQEVISGTTITLSNNVPTKAGATFRGWSTSNGGNIEYQPGNEIEVNSSITLYAFWTMPLINVMKTVAKSDAGVDFSQAPVDGVYTVNTTIGDAHPIHYYRGEVINNNVLFANKCWKIVHTTETGGVKLIYYGTSTNGKCLGTNPTIGTSAFNTNDATANDVRYIHTDGTDSTIKGVIDTWYEENLTDYTSKLEDTPWCMDLSVSSAEGSNIYYGAVGRNVDASNPSLSCAANHQLKVSATDLGLKLKYPVALLTADEITMAGSGYSGYSEDAYLNIYDNWWPLSPAYLFGSYAYIFNMDFTGYLGSDVVDAESYVRPAVSLAPNTEVIDSGDGTEENPYIVR